jgi:hypothetical protein
MGGRRPSRHQPVSFQPGETAWAGFPRSMTAFQVVDQSGVFRQIAIT